jgi:hypothetical protein
MLYLDDSCLAPQFKTISLIQLAKKATQAPYVAFLDV